IAAIKAQINQLEDDVINPPLLKLIILQRSLAGRAKYILLVFISMVSADFRQQMVLFLLAGKSFYCDEI
ncbi:MAG: hypothetical protein MUO54_13140, partial [Anaerolineales bacterium]|nr:hypothetical protein [Anaerolineales bacterium]